MSENYPLRVLCQRGGRSMSVAYLADQLGISRTTMTGYFTDRRGLTRDLTLRVVDLHRWRMRRTSITVEDLLRGKFDRR